MVVATVNILQAVHVAIRIDTITTGISIINVAIKRKAHVAFSALTASLVANCYVSYIF